MSLRAFLSALVSVAVALPALPATAGDSPGSLSDMSLEELLNLRVGVTSVLEARTMRESPGIITVITREEIASSGARDLIDILQMIPGFAMGVDVLGVVSVGFRGNWAHEGKMLVLLDGQEMNERLYSTPVFGNHIPAELIERVEVIRGPGPVTYGGFAELGVINIVTRRAEDADGARASLTYGQLAHDYGRRTVALTGAHRFSSVPGLSVNVSGAIGQGHRSDATYTDLSGNSYDMGQNARVDPMLLSVGIQYRDLQLRFVHDNFHTASRDGFGANYDRADAESWVTTSADLSYTAHLGDTFTLTPYLSYKRQLPWHVTVQDSPMFYDESTTRYLARLSGTYAPIPEVKAMLGAETFRDEAKQEDPLVAGLNHTWLDSQGQEVAKISYADVAAFAELSVKTPLADITGGVRYEYHSAYHGAFVPRLGLTRAFNAFHFKLLYSGSFRAPSFENIRISPDVKTERTTTLEAEAGYQFNPHWFAVVNVFDVNLVGPIIYNFDPATETESFTNQGKTGSRGAESELRFRDTWGDATLNYSFSMRRYDDGGTGYEVPGRRLETLGLPVHKATLRARFKIGESLSVSPSAVLMSSRWGYLSADAGGTPVLGHTPVTLLANLYVSYENLGVKGLDVGLGVFNLFDAANVYVQPYNGGHAPLPGPGREFLGRVSYAFDLH